ncbi:MAG TPA: hypothetical protein VFM88_09660 [Vicinamibacteria bacterium]|nr:hypothetical protein [Vicinamibacteria bacterium]
MTAVLASSMPLAASARAQDSETKATLEQLPAAVQDAVKAQGRGATLRRVAKELKGGVTQYEAELMVDGRRRDVLFDAQGKVVSVEEQKTLSEIPQGARDAILKALGAGKLVLVEEVTKGEATFYEGHISNGGNISEVKVDAAGKPVE